MMDGVPIIEGRIKLSLLEVVRRAAPHEAVGIIHLDEVYELRNDHDFPSNNFAVDRNQLRRLVEQLDICLSDVNEEVILWHSHPSGGVGPSTADMRNKTPLKHHLVVSLVDDDLVSTWY